MKPLLLMLCARKLRATTGAAATSCALGALMVFPGLPGPPAPVPSPPVAVPPIIIVVKLTTTFTPATLQLAVGQQFELSVDGSVEAAGPDIPSTCPGSAPAGGSDGMLLAQCVGNGSYLYTAVQPGSFVLSATVRPHCSPGIMCPQWITEPNLAITITPGPSPQTPPTQGPPPGTPPTAGPAS
ncbi:MAG TPA: hypothetical protein VGM53_13395 [Streptosporangiaceae bacterium]|jgi:hypothetical protein